MTATNDRFWAKVLFREFIRHFRKLNDEQIVRDIRQSMDDLEDFIDNTDTFGSKMVRWSMERADNYPKASENGKKGGRPRKQPSGPMPGKDAVRDFALDNGLDEVDAYNCWYATVNERNGCDAGGNPVTDWKAFVKEWCKTAKAHRKERKA